MEQCSKCRTTKSVKYEDMNGNLLCNKCAFEMIGGVEPRFKVHVPKWVENQLVAGEDIF